MIEIILRLKEEGGGIISMDMAGKDVGGEATAPEKAEACSITTLLSKYMDARIQSAGIGGHISSKEKISDAMSEKLTKDAQAAYAARMRNPQ